MLADVTPAVLTALDEARAYAALQGGPEVQPRHLLQGLLKEEEGRAAVALRQAGVVPAALSGLFPGPVAGTAPPRGPTPLPLSQPTLSILTGAHELARELSGERTVTTDQLLLVLLKREVPLRTELETRGLDLARLEALVCSVQGPPLRLDEPLFLEESVGRIDTARVLDAGANRAREALRVIEDYCRFVLDDAFLSRELKELRHALTETLAGLADEELLEARETLRDVGTALTTAQEQQRYSLRAVVQANLKRLQEALRSLEEFGKLRGAPLGKALEKLRYDSYTLEKAIVLGTGARQRLAGTRLYVLVSGSGCAAALDWTIEEAAAGGAQVFQLREKNLSDRDLIERARRVRAWTRRAEVLFILNDRPDIARLVEADGVHLGQDDLSVKDARRVVGPEALIGVSTHTLEQARQAVLDGASYIGVGPTFPSGTKAFPQLAGLELVRRASAETSLPAFVIGGVSQANLAEAIAAGARRVAVGQAICQADDPRAAAAQLRQQLDQSDSPQ
jgi:thiamine-phosphate pyrophosphorylase